MKSNAFSAARATPRSAPRLEGFENQPSQAGREVSTSPAAPRPATGPTDDKKGPVACETLGSSGDCR
jgi:hypothetical protein